MISPLPRNKRGKNPRLLEEGGERAPRNGEKSQARAFRAASQSKSAHFRRAAIRRVERRICET